MREPLNTFCSTPGYLASALIRESNLPYQPSADMRIAIFCVLASILVLASAAVVPRQVEEEMEAAKTGLGGLVKRIVNHQNGDLQGESEEDKEHLWRTRKFFSPWLPFWVRPRPPIPLRRPVPPIGSVEPSDPVTPSTPETTAASELTASTEPKAPESTETPGPDRSDADTAGIDAGSDATGAATAG